MASRGRPKHPETLTPAEQRVCELVRRGNTNSEIAETLGISLNTVKYHLANSMQKLGVTDRRDLGDARAWRAPGFRAFLSWKTVGWTTAAVGGLAAVVLGMAVLREREPAPDAAVVAYMALSDSQDWQLMATDPTTHATRALADSFKASQVEQLVVGPDGRRLAYYVRPPVEQDCPAAASCPPPQNPAEGWLLDTTLGSRQRVASGLEPNSAPIVWLDHRPVFSSVVHASSTADAEVVSLETLGCAEWTKSEVSEACLKAPTGSDGQWEIVITENGNELLTLLPDGNPLGVQLSPDGAWAFWNRTDREGYEMRLANISAAVDRAKVPGYSAPPNASDLGPGRDAVWAPDSSAFVFLRGGIGSYPDIWLYTLAAGERKISEQPAGGWAPAWSPDAKKIAFISVRDHTYGEVYVFDLASSTMTRVTDNQLAETAVAWIKE